MIPPPNRPGRRMREGGFTLLEMLVAVAILAIALGAIIGNASNYAHAATSLRDRTLALWVARNRLAEIELQPAWPDVGRSNDDVKMGGIEWTWRAEVKTTQDPGLRRIDIRVEKKGDHETEAYATLSTFVSRVGRQTQ